MKNYFNRQYDKIKSSLDLNVKRVLKSNQFILGREVNLLESKLEKLTKTKEVVTVSSGTDALIVALMAINIKPNDEVITTPFSWISTAEVIKFLGAKIVYVDIDPDTFNLDIDKIKSKITNKTKAIMPVSLFGLPCNIEKLRKIIKNKNIKVIEDGAQSFGAKITNKYTTNFPDIFCTSFFPTKPLGCYGDGGACFTNSTKLAKKMKLIRNHCQIKKNVHKGIGLNARLDTLQAAILLSKLKIFEKEINLREKIVLEIKKKLIKKSNKFKFQKVEKNLKSANAQFPIKLKTRNKFIVYLKKNKIGYSIFYPKPIYKQKGYNEKKIFLKNVEKVCKEIICFPVNPYMSKSEIIRFTNKLKNF